MKKFVLFVMLMMSVVSVERTAVVADAGSRDDVCQERRPFLFQ